MGALLHRLVVAAASVAGPGLLGVQQPQSRSHSAPAAEARLFLLLMRDCLELGLEVLAHSAGNEPVHKALAPAC